MGKIKKILENELTGGTQSTEVYPVTSVKAVYDENNKRLDNIIKELDNKVSTQLPKIEEAKNEALNNIKKNEQSAITNFNSQRVTPEMLSESTKQLIEASGGGTITNLADDEDLTSVDDGTGSNVLKFADKIYNVDNFSGKGYKILRKNMVDGKNILTQDMINQANTIYEIKYDFDLNNVEIIIPDGCALKFNGGSLSNGTIKGNNNKDCFTYMLLNDNYLIFNNVFVRIFVKGSIEDICFAGDDDQIFSNLCYFDEGIINKDYNITKTISLFKGVNIKAKNRNTITINKHINFITSRTNNSNVVEYNAIQKLENIDIIQNNSELSTNRNIMLLVCECFSDSHNNTIVGHIINNCNIKCTSVALRVTRYKGCNMILHVNNSNIYTGDENIIIGDHFNIEYWRTGTLEEETLSVNINNSSFNTRGAKTISLVGVSINDDNKIIGYIQNSFLNNGIEFTGLKTGILIFDKVKTENFNSWGYTGSEIKAEGNIEIYNSVLNLSGITEGLKTIKIINSEIVINNTNSRITLHPSSKTAPIIKIDKCKIYNKENRSILTLGGNLGSVISNCKIDTYISCGKNIIVENVENNYYINKSGGSNIVTNYGVNGFLFTSYDKDSNEFVNIQDNIIKSIVTGGSYSNEFQGGKIVKKLIIEVDGDRIPFDIILNDGKTIRFNYDNFNNFKVNMRLYNSDNLKIKRYLTITENSTWATSINDSKKFKFVYEKGTFIMSVNGYLVPNYYQETQQGEDEELDFTTFTVRFNSGTKNMKSYQIILQ